MGNQYEFGKVEHIKAAKQAQLEADIVTAADHLQILLAELDEPKKWQDSLYNHLDHLLEIDKIGMTDGYRGHNSV